MIFLIHYDPRAGGRVVKLMEFESAQRDLATAERLKIEVELLSTGERMEVVTLEAGSLEELKKSHSRYFKSIDEMTDDAKASDGRESSSSPSEKSRGK